ncbi:CocE/NonD family hydrolase C-terminal non-catalytic domain-containing protein [Streptomyces sp. NPDC056524]|uniref:CocE/NonD family hydrolase C-terminal non-catalytic domain-containing protein n=1 Tax=Streptomyces sp. NPDC056524 TaxID=3345851 RepID=UPI003694957B
MPTRGRSSPTTAPGRAVTARRPGCRPSARSSTSPATASSSTTAPRSPGAHASTATCWSPPAIRSPLTGMTGLPDPQPYDLKGTHLGWTTAPLTSPVDVVGSPKATLRVVSPRTERVQDSGDAADKLVLFAKVYDIAPDGRKTLVNRLVAPVRVPDVTLPFTVELPGIVHRYETAHRLEFVIAASDDAYSGNRGVKPVTVTAAPGDTGTLELPVVKGQVR